MVDESRVGNVTRCQLPDVNCGLQSGKVRRLNSAHLSHPTSSILNGKTTRFEEVEPVRRHLSTGAFCAFVMLMQSPAWPQSSNGSLRGAVQDQTAAVVPGVTIVLRDQATGVE